jgi:NAD(P)-dependent dehydrogenase (short-subunit alcohol dehydrogenase family)
MDGLRAAAGANATSLTGYDVDVTNETAVSELIDRIVGLHRRLDALVNTVGGYAGGIKFWELETRVFEQMLNLNLRAGFILARAAAARVMVKQRSGAIVNVAAKAALDHGAGAAAYAASKAGAVAMIDSLAADLRGTGVRANSILPSIIDTEANRKAMPGADFSKWPKPEEIARVILFLCGDGARLISGASVPVYGES